MVPSPYPTASVAERLARIEERVESHDEALTGVLSKLDRLTFAVVGAALSFAVGSGAVVAAVMAYHG